jgi:hypothetical protein
MDLENRQMNIKEIKEELLKKFKINKSQQTIRKYLDELIKENKLKLENE